MTGADAPSIGIAVLAAGASTRLGRPKQLVVHQGSTLLRHAARTAIDAALGPVLVVLGAGAEACREELDGLPVGILIHDGWREGMGSTISAAAQAMTKDGAVAALILTACDQPDVGPGDLRRLAAAPRHKGVAVVGSAYAGTVGIPALFARSRFPALIALTGDAGAKAVLRAEGAQLASVDCPAAAFDIDAEADTIRLR